MTPMLRTCAILWALSRGGSARAASAPTPGERLGPAWSVALDAAGRPRSLSGGAVPVLDAATLAGPPDLLRARALDAAIAFVRAQHDVLDVEPDALRPLGDGVVVAGSGRLVHVLLENAPGGVPVAGSAVTLSISHGNLIHVGLARTERVAASPVPSVTARDALDAALGATQIDAAGLAREPAPVLTFVPDGRSHRLAWRAVLTSRRPPRRTVALVDARTGALISATAETVEACGPPPAGGVMASVKGGVRGERADDPEREELLAFVDAGGATSGRDGWYSPPASPGTARLVGPKVTVDCQDCTNPTDPAATPGPDGAVLFGDGGRDGTGNGTSTPADRTAYFHVEAVKRHADFWLDLPWLDESLLVHTNLDSNCNAYWEGTSLNFFVGSMRCANTGEIRDVMAHEWGHGLDDNDGRPASSLSVDAATGEAVGDIVAMIRGRDACLGESCFASPSDWPSPTCSGVRDLDETAAGHEHGSPATLSTANVASKCGASAYYRGPLGREGHCEGEIFGQAFWHLVQDLRTGVSQSTGAPLPDGPLDDDARGRWPSRCS